MGMLERNRQIMKQDRTKNRAESFDRKGLLKANSHNLGMKFNIGNEGNEFNLTALKLQQTKIYWK